MLVGKVYLKQDNPPQINVVDAAVQRFKFKEEPHAPVVGNCAFFVLNIIKYWYFRFQFDNEEKI